VGAIKGAYQVKNYPPSDGRAARWVGQLAAGAEKSAGWPIEKKKKKKNNGRGFGLRGEGIVRPWASEFFFQAPKHAGRSVFLRKPHPHPRENPISSGVILAGKSLKNKKTKKTTAKNTSLGNAKPAFASGLGVFILPRFAFGNRCTG